LTESAPVIGKIVEIKTQDNGFGPIELGSSELPMVSIVVTVKNEAQTIESCLGSLLDLSYANYEVLVVDTGSTDDTLALVEEICRVNDRIRFLITKGNAPTGRNLGISQARGEIIAFIDGDCIATKGWLKTLVNCLVKNGFRIAGVGGPNIPFFTTENRWTKATAAVLNTFLGSGGSVQVRNGGNPNVRAISTANSAFWIKSVRNVGCFDLRLDLCEDADLCSRLSKAGSRFKFEKAAIVYHHRDYNTLKQFGSHIFKYGQWRGKAMVIKPRVDTSLTSLAVSGIVVLSVLLSLLTIFGSSVAESMMLLFASLYVLIITVNSLIISRGIWTVFLAAIPTFLILHLSYAIGLLIGIVSSMIETKSSDRCHT